MPVARIAAVGMSNTDLVCRTSRLPVAGETIAGKTFSTFAGGKGANQAVAAARAGASVSFIGATGDDAYGRARRSDLQAEGIDIAHLQEIAGETSGIALIVVDDAGENQIVTVAGTNALVDADAAARSVSRLEFDLLLMTWELAPETSAGIVDAVGPAVPIVLNIAPFHESIRGVFPDERLVVICNDVEAGQLLGRRVTANNAQEAATSILAFGCKAVVITLGAAGSVGATTGETWSVMPPEVQVIDTTGAGDAFCGAFATWLAGGSNLIEATEAGSSAGALATTVHGAQPSIPTRDRVLDVLASGQVSNASDVSR